MTLAELNGLASDHAIEALLSCCGSRAWAERVLARGPFTEPAALYLAADEVWRALPPMEWLMAFAAHPRIGARKAAQAQHGAGDAWSAEEQSGVWSAERSVQDRLQELNQAYERRFGHVFLICASGRSAAELLDALEERMNHEPATELRIAAAEQAMITNLRLQRLIEVTP